MVLRSRHGLAIVCLLLAQAAGLAATEPLRLGDGDRLLVLAPHPDDEILSAGGLIQEALGLDLPVRVCFLTMGDNHEIASLFTRRHPALRPGGWRPLGTLRQNEAAAAASQLGLAPGDLVFLGYPDYGAHLIWNRHWRTVPAYRSPLTRVAAVPFARALTPGSAYAGEDILDDLVDVIRDFQPAHLVVSHPADHNADHRALYLFTRIALWNLAAEGLSPEFLAAPVHFSQWPKPRLSQPDQPATPPRELDGHHDWIEYRLAPFQVTGKLSALRRHHSQYQSGANYLNAFIRKSELFGDFSDLILPGGTGSVQLAEDDSSQFRPDADLFQALAGDRDEWRAIAEQNAFETAELGGHDNDFIARTITGDGAALTLSFQFLKPLTPATRLVVAIFGFRADTPFGDMPKMVIDAASDRLHSAMDLDAPLPKDAVEWQPGPPDEVTVRVPFARLGNPEKILTGAELHKDGLPVDWVAWRAIELPGPLPSASTTPARPATAISPAPVPAPIAAPPPAVTLRPRVHLPRPAAPERSEATEAVIW
ncbi:MAG: PIG-L family deacetylase [Kiritimatiellae bacterium]|nr:PIG-L family deacetylase [Kiritimatiellia bacterium]HQQ60654.1 PIG-L family deacetylase [Kiritimatiellia bacterium]